MPLKKKNAFLFTRILIVVMCFGERNHYIHPGERECRTLRFSLLFKTSSEAALASAAIVCIYLKYIERYIVALYETECILGVAECPVIYERQRGTLDIVRIHNNPQAIIYSG